jgi:hypothetical protein
MPTRATTKPRKGKGVPPASKPKGGGKGYQRSQEHTPGTLPPTTLITGSVGTVKGLWSRIDDRLRVINMSWRAMASEAGYTRQYIMDCLQRGRMPYKTLRLVCGVLGWEINSVVSFSFTQITTDDKDTHGED